MDAELLKLALAKAENLGELNRFLDHLNALQGTRDNPLGRMALTGLVEDEAETKPIVAPPSAENTSGAVKEPIARRIVAAGRALEAAERRVATTTRKRRRNPYQPWTNAQKNKLKELWSQPGMTNKRIAQIVRHSRYSVAAAASKMGLGRKPWRHAIKGSIKGMGAKVALPVAGDPQLNGARA